MPVLAIMGLQSFFRLEKVQQLKAIYKSDGVFFGIIVILFLIKGQFGFGGGNDSYYMQSYGPQFVDALKADRRSLYSADLLRSAFLVLVAAGVLWMFLKEKLARTTAVILVGLIMVADLFFIAKNYVDSSAFVSARMVDIPFEPTPSDKQILQDTTLYRVFEVGAVHNARTSYFHKSLSGYSAVRPRRMEELLTYQIAESNIGVLNMLNTKYIIQTDEKGQEFPIANPEANGNAWFINAVKLVESADQEMKALDSLDTKNVAIVNRKEFGQFIKSTSFAKDSVSANIAVETHKPNYIKYRTSNPNPGFAVFSEIYYPQGWNAFIDGKKVPHFRADYTLRALLIPAGQHTVEFKFEPEIVKTGGTISLISSILILLAVLAAFIYSRRKKSDAVAQ
jgi:hypothetical protein